MAVIYLLVLLFAADNRPVTVCDIHSAKGRVTIRGVGGQFRDGPVLFDYTCPLATANGFVLPRSILIDNHDDSPQDQHSAELKDSVLFQAVIEGDIECREPMTIQRSDDGDIVGGNGFGSLGLFNCRMKKVRVKVIYSLSDELGLSAPAAKR